MASAEYISFALSRQISLVFAEDVSNSQDKRSPEGHAQDTNLTLNDCEYIWEEVKYADKIRKLGDYFEESSKMLLQQLMKDQLSQKDKQTILNFLCQSGAVSVTMESSRNTSSQKKGESSTPRVQKLPVSMETSTSQYPENISDNLSAKDIPTIFADSNSEIFSKNVVGTSSQCSDRPRHAKRDMGTTEGGLKKPMSSLGKSPSRRFKMGKPRRFGIKKEVIPDYELVEATSLNQDVNDQDGCVSEYAPVMQGHVIQKDNDYVSGDYNGKRTMAVVQEEDNVHADSSNGVSRNNPVGSVFQTGSSDNTAMLRADHIMADQKIALDASVIKSGSGCETQSSVSDVESTEHSVDRSEGKFDDERSCEEFESSEDVPCNVEIPGSSYMYNAGERNSHSNREDSGISKGDVSFVESVSHPGGSREYRSEVKGESAPSAVKVELEQRAVSDQGTLPVGDSTSQFDSANSAVQDFQNFNPEGAVLGADVRGAGLEYVMQMRGGDSPSNDGRLYEVVTQGGKTSYQCVECGKKFMHKRSVSFHVRMHNERRIYTCNICGAKTLWKSSFRRHLKLHTGEELFDCHHCGKSFQTKCILMCHMRSHTGEKPFKCDVCKKSFSQKNVLKTHMRVHTGERPYECHFCKRRYNSKDYLARHVKFHTEKKNFQCGQCEAIYDTKRELSAHMWVHTVEATYLSEKN